MPSSPAHERAVVEVRVLPTSGRGEGLEELARCRAMGVRRWNRGLLGGSASARRRGRAPAAPPRGIRPRKPQMRAGHSSVAAVGRRAEFDPRSTVCGASTLGGTGQHRRELRDATLTSGWKTAARRRTSVSGPNKKAPRQHPSRVSARPRNVRVTRRRRSRQMAVAGGRRRAERALASMEAAAPAPVEAPARRPRVSEFHQDNHPRVDARTPLRVGRDAFEVGTGRDAELVCRADAVRTDVLIEVERVD